MPDDAGPTGDNGAADQKGATFTQAEVEKIVQQRVASVQKKYADYDSLKAQAEELKKFQDSRKSEEEKLAERIAAAEAKAAEALAAQEKALLEATRLKVATDKELPKEFHDLLTGTSEEELVRQADRILEGLEKVKSQKPSPPPTRRPTPKPGSQQVDDSGDKPSNESINEWIRSKARRS